MPDVRIAFLHDHSRRASEQMEIDRLLLQKLGSGWPGLLRVYRFSGPCVTVGRTFRQELPKEWGGAPDVAVRPTGGGAVLHGDDLCFSLFLSSRPSASPRFLYPLFHDWIRSFLSELSVEASMQSGTSSAPHPGRLCFEEPVCGDLLWKSRKVMGRALRVTAKGLLYQGSLHVPGYSGDALEEGFVSWYPKTGDVRLRVALEREGILCPA